MTVRPILSAERNTYHRIIFVSSVFAIVMSAISGGVLLFNQLKVLSHNHPAHLARDRETASVILRSTERAQFLLSREGLTGQGLFPAPVQPVAQWVSASPAIEQDLANLVVLWRKKHLQLVSSEHFGEEQQLVEIAFLARDLSVTGRDYLFAKTYEKWAHLDELTKLLAANQATLRTYLQNGNAVIAAAKEQEDQLIAITTMTGLVFLGVFALFSILTLILFRGEINAERSRRKAEDYALYISRHDALTGLANRSLFEEEGRQALMRRDPTLLIHIDLDFFKMINDNNGHAAGDEILRVIGERLKSFSDLHDGIASRLGGDEFAILLPAGRSYGESRATCEKLINLVAGPVSFDGKTLYPRASMGIMEIPEGSSGCVFDYLADADVALYAAKTKGRNQFAFYSVEMARQHRQRKDINAAIPAALQDNEFELRFQPQISLAHNRLAGFEVLVRWNRGGTIWTPDKFIAVAEENGTIKDIDYWVVKSAAKQIRLWREEGFSRVNISINLSAVNFNTHDIVDIVESLIRDEKLDPRQLTLEITESVLIERMERATEIILDLQSLGVKVSIDDFGTGYSSLAYLRELTLDEVKIDRSLIKDIETSGQARQLLSGILEITRGLGKSVVVEGIETANQRDIVTGFGAHTGQGYFFGAPMTEEAARRLLTPDAGGRPQTVSAA